MIINILRQLMFLFLILFLGINFLKLFKLKMGIAEKLSSGFTLGIGFSTFGLFLLGFIDYRFNFWNVFLFLAIGNLLLIFIRKLFIRKSTNLSHLSFIKLIKSFDLIEKILICGIAFFLIMSLIRTLYWPVWMWDAVQLYDYGAKLIVSSQTIFFPAQSFYDISYPLLTSVFHSILYIAGSPNPQYIYSLIFASLIFGVYAFTRSLSNRKAGLALAFLISFYPLFYGWSLNASSDLTQSTFLVLGVFYLVKWLSKEKTGYLILGSLFFAFGRFTRNEPIWIFVLILLVIYLFIKKTLFIKKNLFNIIIFVLPNYLVGYIYNKYLTFYNFDLGITFKSQFGFVTQLSNSLHNFNFKMLSDSVIMVFNSVILEMLIPTFFIFVFLYLDKFKMRKELLLLYFCVSFLLIFIGGTLFYRITSSYTDFLALGSSLAKFSIFWKILVFVIAFLVFYDFWTNFHRGKKYEK